MIGELAALGAALSWTVSAMLYRRALQEAKPVTANIVRLSCTGAILLLLLVAFGLNALMNLPSYALVLGCVSGIIGLGFGDTLYLVSLKKIGVVRAVPITCTYPLFGLLWAVLLVGEALTVQVFLGAVVIVLGVWLLSREENAGADSVERKDLANGVICALATAILWSVSITMMDVAVTLPASDSIGGAFAVNTVRVLAIAVCLLVLSPVLDRERSFLKLPRRTIATLIVGGLVALGLGWFFLAYSFTQTLESQAVPLSSTTPLFSTLAGAILLHERATVKTILGSTVIVAGIFLIFLI